MAIEEEGGPLRRVDIDLFIVHPLLRPTDITAALGLDPLITHCVGDPRKTRKGALLPGRYADTRWRYRIRHESRGQWFAKGVTELVNRLGPHKSFLLGLRETGGRADISLWFDDGYHSDGVSARVIARMAELGLGLGIEC